MRILNIGASVFDPVSATELIPISEFGIDNWYEHAVITQSLRDRLLNIPKGGESSVQISSGMSIILPFIEIGVKIGSIKLYNLKAYIVANGDYDLILGRDAITKVFTIGSENDHDVEISTKKKDDKASLSLKLHSIDKSYRILNISNFLNSQRILFNILMIINNEIEIDSNSNLDDIIDNEIGIPENKRLKLSWIEEGSIWLTLKSAAKTLKEFGKIFGESKLSELKKEFSEAEKSKTESEILTETRSLIVARKKEEERKLMAENINETYRIWRKEMQERIKFQEEIIDKIEDKKLAGKLKKKLNQTIASMLEQEMFPEIINLPDIKLLGENPRNLPTIFEE